MFNRILCPALFLTCSRASLPRHCGGCPGHLDSWHGDDDSWAEKRVTTLVPTVWVGLRGGESNGTSQQVGIALLFMQQRFNECTQNRHSLLMTFDSRVAFPAIQPQECLHMYELCPRQSWVSLCSNSISSGRVCSAWFMIISAPSTLHYSSAHNISPAGDPYQLITTVLNVIHQ